MKRLRPFFKYFGSKHRLVPLYPSPRTQMIVEPFAGSAQYSTLYHDRDVLLCEVNPEICELWQWLIDAKRSDIADLPYELKVGSDIRELELPAGAALLIRSWQRVGRSKCWTVSKWNASNTGFWCKSTRDCIASQVRHIKHWRVKCCDYRDIDERGATFFVDPPYISQPKYPNTEPMDYKDLVSTVRRWEQGNDVIVCEAAGATWLPFDKVLPKALSMRRAEGKEFTDAYYTNI